MISLRALWALCLAAVFVVASSAQDFSLPNGVAGTARSPWPAKVPRGYVPVFVELVNTGDREADVDLRVHTAYGMPNQPSGAAQVALRLAPGERRELELLHPLHRTVGWPPWVRVASAGSSNMVQLMMGNDVVDPADRLVAWVAPRPLTAGTVERIGGELEASDPAASMPGVPPRPTSSLGYMPHGGAVSTIEWEVFELGPRDLPSRAAAWTSVDAIVVDAREGEATLAGLALEPIASYVRQGGLALVLGERAALARLVGDVALLDSRLAEGTFGRSGEAWRFGTGRIAWLPGDAGELADGADRAALLGAVAETHALPHRIGPYVPGTPAALEHTEGVVIPGLGRVPTQVFVLLLVVFAILIGPVNLYTLKRLGRPGLLIVTIPVISLVASLGILGFGIFNQGIDLKGAVHSFTLLDQRSERAVTLARYALVPGLALDALEPERGTTVHPTAYTFERGRPFTVEHGEGLRLTGGWAPVRTLSNLMVSSDAPARARLELRRTAEGFEVTNTLAVTLRNVHLRDSTGALYGMDPTAALAPGSTLGLRPLVAAQTGFVMTTTGINVVSGHALDTRSSWYALADSNPFLDTLGLEPNLKETSHVLQGLLPADEAAWTK